MFSCKRGQGAVEFLIILSVSLAIILSVYSLGTQTVVDMNKRKILEDAENSVKSLAEAVDDVYRQGEGAKRYVYYDVPDTIDESLSGTENQTIRFNVMGSDIIAETNAPLSGTLNLSPGRHWVWFSAYEGYVAIGEGTLDIDKTSIYLTLAQSDSETDYITVTNGTGGTATVDIGENWAHTDVNMQLSADSFTVNDGEDYNLSLSFSSNSTSAGNYAGYITVNASYGGEDVNLYVPINIEVVSAEADPLIIFPASWTASVFSGGGSSQSFNVCNTTDTDLTNVQFTMSAGDAGDWVSPIPAIPALSANTCEIIDANLTVPGGASTGMNTGTITATDDSSNTDTIALFITVEQAAGAFDFSWFDAYFSDSQRLDYWYVENLNDGNSITLNRMRILDYNISDNDGAQVDRIFLNSTLVWDSGGVSAGQWMDISDFTITAGDSFNDNRLRFTADAQDDGEYFRIEFEFDDNSVYTTGTFYTEDTNAPIITLLSPAPGATSYLAGVRFDFNVYDRSSGIANCELVINGATDDTNNSIAEGVTQYFFKDDFTSGTYGWDVNCTDDSGNSNEGTSDENRQINIIVIGPFTVDLSEHTSDRPQPLDFGTDINSSANTFGAGAEYDGWDWGYAPYSSNSECVMFNADPNEDDSSADSTVGSENKIIVHIGDYDNSCNNTGSDNSGAYGIQFDINSDHWLFLQNGGSASLTFDWYLEDYRLDNNDEVWIKARFGNSSGMTYLGSDLDGSDSHADATDEIFWDNNPNEQGSSEDIDVSSLITGTGAYYLELGAKVYDWGNNEWLEAEFDNIDLVIS